jgi:hypothetical protein
LSARGVARNELLTRDYDPTMPDLKVRRGVARAATGVSYAAGWGSVRFDIAYDTREFAGQSRMHGFGAITLHMTF